MRRRRRRVEKKQRIFGLWSVFVVIRIFNKLKNKEEDNVHHHHHHHWLSVDFSSFGFSSFSFSHWMSQTFAMMMMKVVIIINDDDDYWWYSNEFFFFEWLLFMKMLIAFIRWITNFCVGSNFCFFFRQRFDTQIGLWINRSMNE